MSRFLVWVTLIAIVITSQQFVTSGHPLSVVNATTLGTASTGQTQSTAGPLANNEQDTSLSIINAPVIQINKTFEQQCKEQLGPSGVQVNIPEIHTKFEYTKSVTELTSMSQNQRSLTLGLTVSQPRVSFVWNMEMLRDKKSNRVCMKPHIHITIDAGTQYVYVGREFAQKSCAFKEILEHELRHVEANKKIAGQIAAQTQQHIANSIGDLVVYGRSQQEVEGHIVDAIDNYWMPMVKNKFAEAKKHHHNIDTPEEYRRVHESCNGEVATTVGNVIAGGN